MGGGNVLTKHIMVVVPGRLLREGIEHLLGGQDRVFVGDCKSLAQVSQAIETITPPDLLVVGVDNPEKAAETFAHVRELRVRLPEARWIILTRRTGLMFLRDAVEAGVDGLLLEDSSATVLRLVTELVLLGQSFVPAELAKILRASPAPPAAAQPEMPVAQRRVLEAEEVHEIAGPAPIQTPRRKISLSERESQILQCLVAGHSNKLIARELDIAEATVKAHVKALLRKMQVSNRTQAAISALQFLRQEGEPEGKATPSSRGDEAPPTEQNSQSPR